MIPTLRIARNGFSNNLCFFYGALLALSLLSGCAGQPTITQISAFGTAATVLSEHTEKGLELINDASITRKEYEVARTLGEAPTDETFRGIITGDALSTRLATVRQIGLYASGLKKLAEADVRKDVSDAATELNGALAGLANTTAPDETEREKLTQGFTLITDAINAIGQQVVEQKKHEAIKVIIIQANDIVGTAADLINSEMGKDSEISKFATQSLRNVEATLKGAYQSEHKKINLEKRVEMLKRIRAMHNTAKASVQFFEQISAGTEKLKEAHGALKLAVEKNNFSIPEVISSVSQLVDIAIRISEFSNQTTSTASAAQ